MGNSCQECGRAAQARSPLGILGKENQLSKKEKSKRPLRLVVYPYLILILLILCTVASYTWFSISSRPQVSDMGLYVNAPAGLELSADPLAEEWTQQLDFAEHVGESAPLRPITWSEREQRFYAGIYGLDGRLIDRWEPLNDERHANKDNADGYYLKGVFYARTDQHTSISLSPAVEIEEGLKGAGTFLIGTPVWNAEETIHNNGGNGAEKAMRIGIRIEKTDLNGVLRDEEPLFYIYEPNAETHLNENGGYIETPSIDGTPTLIPSERIIVQTTSDWAEVSPVQRTAVVHRYGQFVTDTELFELKVDELAKISIYVWLEGQDVDCTNAIGRRAQILANIQFSADFGSQSGLKPIEY